jgi:hypothetical protein
MLAGFAQFEREQILERSVSGQRAKALREDWPGGAAPYGYRLEGSKRDCRCVIDDGESKVLCQAIDWMIDGALTTGQIASRLNGLGLVSREGKPWTHQRLRRILLQTAAHGIVRYGDPDTKRGGHRASGRYGPPIEVPVPVLISPDRYVLLQACLARKSTGPRRGGLVYPLSGRLASVCGGLYGATPVERASGRRRKYRCKNGLYNSPRRQDCKCPWLDAEEIEIVVWREIQTLLGEPERLLAMSADWLELRSRQVIVEESALETLDQRIASLDRAITQTAAEALRSGAPVQPMVQAMKGIQAELDQLLAHRADLIAWQGDSKAESRRMAELTELARIANANLSTMDLDEQKVVLELLNVQVTALDASKTPRLTIEGEVLMPGILTGLQTQTPVLGTSVPPTSRATRNDSTMRSPTGSASAAFNRSRHSTNRPLAR